MKIDALRYKTDGTRDVLNITVEACEELSKSATTAALIDLRESMSGYHIVYQDGVARQVKIERHLLDYIVEIIGRAQPFDRHLGYTS